MANSNVIEAARGNAVTIALAYRAIADAAVLDPNLNAGTAETVLGILGTGHSALDALASSRFTHNAETLSALTEARTAVRHARKVLGSVYGPQQA